MGNQLPGKFEVDISLHTTDEIASVHSVYTFDQSTTDDPTFHTYHLEPTYDFRVTDLYFTYSTLNVEQPTVYAQRSLILCNEVAV